MDIDEATRVLLDERAEFKRLEARQEAAQAVAKRWFREHPGETTYEGPNGRLEYSRSSQLRLDTTRVKVHLAHELARFQYEATIETVRASVPLAFRQSLEAHLAARDGAGGVAGDDRAEVPAG